MSNPSIYQRNLTADERSLQTHISMFGSRAYPVKKVGSRHWSWSYRNLSAPRVYPTKHEATMSLERYLAVLDDCSLHESWMRLR